MPIWDEYRFRFTLPDERAFRFEQCAAYNAVKSRGVKEMDFGWLDGQTLWLMEFKNYGAGVPATPKKEHLQDNLAEKIRDSLMLLGTAWSQTAFGNQLHGDIVQTCSAFPQRAIDVRPLVVMNLERKDATRLITPLRDEIEALLDGVLHCFGVSHIPVLPAGHPMIEDRLGIRIARRQ